MSALDLLTWMGFGLLAGGLAKLIMPGKDPGGCLVTIALGIAGAFLGGWAGEWLGWGGLEGPGLRSLALAIVGALLLLLLYRLAFGWRARRDFQASGPLDDRRDDAPPGAEGSG